MSETNLEESTMRKFQFIVLIALLALLPLACSKTETEHAATETKSAVSDASITAAVKSKFAADDLVAAHDINVTTDHGVVALTGKVNSQTELDRAIEIANSTEGVRTVRSYLTVDTASADLDRDDLDNDLDDAGDKIEDSAERVGDSAKEGLDKLGDKTKEGLDKTKEGLDKLGDNAQDATITAAIKLKFAGDDVVKASAIDIDTQNGQVTLKGTVGSRQEEQKAIQLAKTVDGVTQVRSSLTIKSQ